MSKVILYLYVTVSIDESQSMKQQGTVLYLSPICRRESSGHEPVTETRPKRVGTTEGGTECQEFIDRSVVVQPEL